MAARISGYLAHKMANYQTNHFEPLPPALSEIVAERWGAYAEEFGYAAAMGGVR